MAITIDVKKGDTILVGKFKNKKITFKEAEMLIVMANKAENPYIFWLRKIAAKPANKNIMKRIVRKLKFIIIDLI